MHKLRQTTGPRESSRLPPKLVILFLTVTLLGLYSLAHVWPPITWKLGDEKLWPKYCRDNPSDCSTLLEVRTKMSHRAKWQKRHEFGDNISIFVEDNLKSWFGNDYATQYWFLHHALLRCPVQRCVITSSAKNADVILHNGKSISDMERNINYAQLSLEAHTLWSGWPLEGHNVILIHLSQQSDVRLTYGSQVTNSMRLCLGQRVVGQKCDNLENPETSFHKWCAANFQGDPYTCLFNVMPHLMRTNADRVPAGAAAKRFAATWMSATCERHSNYLERLMKHIEIDSMGGCHHTLNELDHPGLRLADRDDLWWGPSSSLLGGADSYAARKMVISSHYKFFISFENTILDDYVTEKFYEGFLSDALLVYFGAPNAREYAPADHSFINALEFRGPEELAGFLVALAGDPARYEAYFRWRRAVPARVAPRFRELLGYGLQRTDESSIMCRLCTLLAGPPAPAAQGR